jgi:heat shock protein HtpX
MWELIAANRRKSFILFIIMGIVLIALGYFIGGAYAGDKGGIAGIFIACMIWFILSLVSYFAGDSIVLAMSNAKEVTQDNFPKLYDVVEEMKIAAGLPQMPKIYVINDEAPNAFSTGRKPDKSAVAVTAGLLSRLNRDELQGVVAHETSHIVNRDVLFMTFAGIMLGSIVIISEVFLRSFWFTGGSGSRYRSSDREDSGGGQLQLILMVVAIVFAILAPILAQLLYFAISRKREYLADASAAKLTRYPEGLASALEKISQTDLELKSANKVTAPMYIINPLRKEGMKKLSDLSSTHPPISERIRILRSISNGASFANYQAAFSLVKGKPVNILPKSALAETEQVDIRKPGEAAVPQSSKSQKRSLGDIMMTVNKYSFITCSCGLKIKIPPGFGTNKPQITCPKCGKVHDVPMQQVAAAIGTAE